MIKDHIIRLPAHTQFGLQGMSQFLDIASKTLRDIPFSLILHSRNKYLYFVLRADEEYLPIIENQFYSIYPNIEFEATEAQLLPQTTENGVIARLRLKHHDHYPFLLHDQQQGSFLTTIYSQLNQIGINDEFFYQIKILPIDYQTIKFRLRRNWHLELKQIKERMNFLESFRSTKASAENRSKSYQLAQSKNKLPLYQVEIEIGLKGQTTKAAQLTLNSLLQTFRTLESDFNEFSYKIEPLTSEKVQKTNSLQFSKTSYVFTADEISTVFHFPPNSSSVPNLYISLSPKAEPPIGLPTLENTDPSDINVFAETNYRNVKQPFGIKMRDRARHVYIIGKSGSGKSKLQELLIKNDIEAGFGVCVIDPHGDLIDHILPYIPESRVKDTIFFDPTDEEYPISFNPLEKVQPIYRQQVASNLIEVFKKAMGANWTPRLEHVLRMTLLALLDAESSSISSILLILTDRNYRHEIIKSINDSVVKNFWTNEFAGWSEKFDSEAIMPILNKIGQFLSNPIIRNIVSQEDNKLVMNDVMNSSKILLVKLPKGILGEENTSLLGSMIITKIYQNTLARATMPESQRVPFFMYVDEFQNFATDSFTNILSESRKYKLSVTLAHQYISQLPDQIRNTIFGNIGSLISFRLGPEDAALIEKEFEPKFEANDIINLAVQEIYLKMSINDEVREAFSARVLYVAPSEKSYVEEIREYTRVNYCKPLVTALEEIKQGKSKELEILESLQSQSFSSPLV